MNCGARKQQQQMDPGRGCPAQIPDRGQHVHSSHRSEEEVSLRYKGPRGRTAHTDKMGTGRAEGEEMSDGRTLEPAPDWSSKLPDKLKLAIADCILLFSNIESCIVELVWLLEDADIERRKQIARSWSSKISKSSSR